jgi:hypothetical protein
MTPDLLLKNSFQFFRHPFIFTVMVFVACGETPLELYQLRGVTMGTQYMLKCVGPPDDSVCIGRYVREILEQFDRAT